MWKTPHRLPLKHGKHGNCYTSHDGNPIKQIWQQIMMVGLAITAHLLMASKTFMADATRNGVRGMQIVELKTELSECIRSSWQRGG